MGADRDSGILNSMGYFDERNIAVKRSIKILIDAAHKYGKQFLYVVKDHLKYPEFAEFFLVQQVSIVSA